MKKFLTLLSIAFFAMQAQAQFGHQNKETLDKIRETELIVILSDDSTDLYNTAIQTAITDYWKISAARFVKASEAAVFAKKGPEGFSYLTMVKGPGAKVKCKCSTSELDLTGLIITTKYKKGKIVAADIAASALIDQKIGDGKAPPTQEEYDAQFIRAVQFLQNFFDLANETEKERDLEYEAMQKKYPGDRTLAEGKKLLVDKKMVEDEKQKTAISKAWEMGGGEVEFVDQKTIATAIVTQDENIVIWCAPMFEAETHRMFVTAKDSRILTYEIMGPAKNMLTAKDVSKLFKK